MIPVICWSTFNTKNQSHIDALVKAGFKGLRIFFNLCDLQQNPNLNTASSSADWQLYINHCFVNTPDGMHAWTYEGKPGLFSDNSKMRDSFDLCKRLGWLPIVCLGYQEELPHNWLGRAPGSDKWPWLTRFTKELGLYLKNTMGFTRADAEIYNEPSKLQQFGFGWDKYVTVSVPMAKAWHSVSSNYKVHVFADDIQRLEYLEKILTHKELMDNTDYISAHIGVGSEDSEWDNNLIWNLYNRINQLNLKVKIALTEMSVNGIWDRFNQLPGKVEMYGIILAIRKKVFGTALRIDDVWLYDSNLECTSASKRDFLTNFNKKYNTWGAGQMYNANTQLAPNFKYGEFFCNGIQPPDIYYPNILVVAKELQKVRDIIKIPIKITSGWRTIEHNASVGGATNSQHLTGKAADSKPIGMDIPKYNIYLAKYTNFNGYGVALNYTHTDTRNAFTIWDYV